MAPYYWPICPNSNHGKPRIYKGNYYWFWQCGNWIGSGWPTQQEALEAAYAHLAFHYTDHTKE